MKKLILLFLLMAVFILAVETAKSGNLTLPNSFSTGQLIEASDMNANFNAVETAIDDNDSRISTNTGNISTNSTNVSSNSTAISGKQNRVTGWCSSGSSIRVINASGSVTCETDDTGGITDNSVYSRHIVNGEVTAADIATSAVGSSEIADGSVTSTDIANGTITGSDIASGSIYSSDIANGTITGSDIASNTITNSDIRDKAAIDWRYWRSNRRYLLSSSIVNMTDSATSDRYPLSVFIPAYVRGIIHLEFTGFAETAAGNYAYIGFSRGSGIWWGSMVGRTQIGSPSYVMHPFSVSSVYDAGTSSSGRTVTFYALAQRYAGTGNSYVYPKTFTATLIPYRN